MKSFTPILLSEYSTLEYFLWRKTNLVEDNISTYPLKAKENQVKSRNLISDVEFSDGEKLFVKQGTEIENNFNFIKNESKSIAFIQKENDNLFNFSLPKQKFYDENYNIIAFEYLHSFVAFDSLFNELNNEENLKEISNGIIEIAKKIAVFHLKFNDLTNNEDFINGFPANVPLLSDITKALSPNNISNFTNLGLEINKYNQLFQENVKTLIEDFNKIWTDNNNTLIHFDFRPHNIMINKDTIMIVDWEMCALGDFMYDIAFFINTIPILCANSELVYDEERKASRKESIRIIKLFWDTYLAKRNLKNDKNLTNKLRVFWKIIQIRRYLVSSRSTFFEKLIDEIVDNLL